MGELLQNEIFFWIILTVTFLLGVFTVKYDDYDDKSGASNFWRIMFIIVSPILCLVISKYLIFRNMNWNLILFIFIFIVQLASFIIKKVDSVNKSFGAIILVATVILIGQFSFIVYNKMWNNEIKNITGVASSNIGGSLDKTLTNIANEIDEKSKALESLKARKSELLIEIEQYNTISEVTKSEADAIIGAFKQDKYKDDVIGFFIGLFSSFLVALIAPNLKLR